MAHSPLRFSVASLVFVLACSTSSGGSSDAATTLPDANGGGQANSGNAGDGEAAGATGGGASDANNGSSGGSANDGGNPGSGDAAANGDASTAKIDCDPRRILCKIAETPCPEGEVHEVIDRCYGPCVKITACPCDEAADCPHDEAYTCWNHTKHCNYYGP